MHLKWVCIFCYDFFPFFLVSVGYNQMHDVLINLNIKLIFQCNLCSNLCVLKFVVNVILNINTEKYNLKIREHIFINELLLIT